MAQTNTKEKLISTAKVLFAKYNYDFVSTRMLAEAAGVGQSAIFFHFGSKEELGKAVIQDILKYFDSYYFPVLDEMDELKEKGELDKDNAFKLIEKSIATQIDVVFDSRNSSVLVYSVNGLSLPREISTPLLESNVKYNEEPLAQLICAYKESNNIEKARVLSHTLTSSIVGFKFVNVSYSDFGVSDEDIKQIITESCMNSIINSSL